MKNDTKQIIIQTSIKLFYKKGYSATTTAEIASEAGVAEVTLFRHFKTKKELLLNILEQFLEIFGQEIIINPINEIIHSNNSGSVKDIIKLLLKDRLELLEKNYDVFWIVLTEMRHHPELKERFFSGKAKEGLTIIRNTVEYGIKNGEFKNLDTDAIIRSLFGTVISIVVSKAALSKIFDSCDNTDILLDNAIEILMNGIALDS